MWCKLSIFCLIVIFPVVLSAQQGDFEIRLVNDSSIIHHPGVSSNIAIKLVNNTNFNQQVSLKIDIPKGWKCFSGLKAIQIPASQSTIKILSFSIPGNVLAANYSIHIEAFDSLERQIAGLSLPVTIKPKFELKIEMMSAPEYVFAGDTFSVQFMVQNLSNSKAEIETILKGTGNDEKMSFLLNPDSSVFITRSMRAEKGFLSYIQKNISLTASLVNMPEVRASTNHFFKLIPSGGVKYDPYNRFPVEFSTLFVTDNPGGERLYALMVDVKGHGFLDEKNTKTINFHLQGPDRRGKPLYGIYDEYWIEYLTPKSKYLLGDNNYSLSYLTEYSRYGRGAKTEHSFGYFTVGSFITFPRFFPNIKREIAVYAGYSQSKKLLLNVGYLNKLSNTNEVSHLMTFNGTGAPVKWVNLVWEYAIGSYGNQYKQAIKTELNLNFKSVHLAYNYTMAEKNFPGYFTDTRYMQANASVRLSKKISVGANYSNNHQNAALDTLYGSAPFSKSAYFSVNYQFVKNGGLSASYNFRDRQDRMEPMKFDYNENSMRLSLYKHFSKFGCDLMGEYGNTENLLMPEEKRLNAMYQGRLTMNYRISDKFNLNGYVNYQESNRYLVNDDKNWIYGTSINAMFTKKMSLSVNYQSSYSVEEYYQDRSILDGRMRYMPNKNNRIELSSRYNLTKNSMDVKQLAFEARFVHTFNVPVSKKKNIGRLTGRVINKGVSTVEGIVISIGTSQAVTDKNGNYSFPMLPAGEYYLMIDYTKAGVFTIPEFPGPYRVEIMPGIENRFDIALTQSGNITGEISIVKDVDDGNKNYAAIREQLGKLLVEAKCGNEVYRIFTKNDGTFSFESLRPGEWTVKVYENNIPSEYELATGSIKLNLKSGQSEQVKVEIKEKRRAIKFQKSFISFPPATPAK